MTPPRLIDANGRPFPLGARIGGGGEGAVFLVPSDAGLVAKVYLQPPTSQTAEKLMVMTQAANPALLKVAAWPTSLLYEARTRLVAGFAMPRLTNCQPIQHLYNPIQRLKSFPKAGWRFQVHAAANLAAAFDEVHKTGCLVGDVNQSNVQVSTQALVTLIDCDSFQVKAGNKNYLCEVGVPHYTPPELQGKSFAGAARTENHDRFGLAVLLFQMLYVGKHPYSGRYNGPDTFEELIAHYRFAHGPSAATWQMKPPYFSPSYSDIPPDLFKLFRRAFERGSERDNRPTAGEWVMGLQALQPKIINCNVDDGHNYWNGAGACPWCRLAKSGMEYYTGVASGTVSFNILDPKLQEVIRRLKAVERIHFPFKIESYRAAINPVGKRPPPEIEDQRKLANAPIVLPPPPSGAEKREYQITALVLGSVGGLGLLLMPLSLFAWQFLPVGAIAATIFGVWLAIYTQLSPFALEKKRSSVLLAARRKEKRAAEADYEWLVRGEYEQREKRLATVKKLVSSLELFWAQIQQEFQYRHSAADGRIRVAIQSVLDLPKAIQIELQNLTANAEVRAKLRHLRLHQIADAYIPNFGPGRINSLAGNGILTAADIESDTIMKIPGFGRGLTQNLLDWKMVILGTFQFNPATAVAAADKRVVVSDFRNREQTILAEIEQQLSEMESLPQLCRAELEKQIPNLLQAAADLQQAVADAQVVKKLK